VQYEYQGISSNAVPVRVEPTAASLFTLDNSGKGSGAILDSSYRVISKDNPARKGDVLLLFATGGGITIPPGADGQIALAPAFPVLAARTSVMIGGVDCPVLYAGSARAWRPAPFRSTCEWLRVFLRASRPWWWRSAIPAARRESPSWSSERAPATVAT